MTTNTDPDATRRTEARQLEKRADADQAYPDGTTVTRPNAP